MRERAIQEAKSLYERGKIRVFYFAKQGPLEEKDPKKMLACLFSSCMLGPGSLPGIDFKKPFEIRLAEDFEPLMRMFSPRTKLGVQIGNPSIAMRMELKRYSTQYSNAIEKKKQRQQLSGLEESIVRAVEENSEELYKLHLARYHQHNLNFMASIGLSLAGEAEKRGIPSVVSICPDDQLSDSYLEKITYLESFKEQLRSDYSARLSAWMKVIEKAAGKPLHMHLYLQSELDSPTCHCGFCMGRPCPGRAAEAVKRLADLGCNTIVNFYMENDGFPTGSFPHFERIERGMLHRTVMVGDDTLRCNVYFGANRRFMVIHEPSEKNEGG